MDTVRGLTRGLIALLIVVLAALALAVTIISAAPDASDLRKTIVTSLLSVLATIAGFYFGSRTAQTAASDAAGGSTRTPTSTAPSDTKADQGNTVAADTTAPSDTKADQGNTVAADTTAPSDTKADEENTDTDASDKNN
jgi:heme A synthase